jgi:hypothetical protein
VEAHKRNAEKRGCEASVSMEDQMERVEYDPRRLLSANFELHSLKGFLSATSLPLAILSTLLT